MPGFPDAVVGLDSCGFRHVGILGFRELAGFGRCFGVLWVSHRIVIACVVFGCCFDGCVCHLRRVCLLEG